jgi:hypothetical protein
VIATVLHRGLISGYTAPRAAFVREEIDRTRLVEGFAGRFCSSQIFELLNTPPKESAVYLIVSEKGPG